MAQLPFNEFSGSPVDCSQKPASRPPLSVGQVASLIKRVLGDNIPSRIRVVGEISNFGDRVHWFFSLKDENASLRCACFASSAKRMGFTPTDGMQVVATGRLDFYDAQGSLQFYVDHIEPVGQGALELQLRAMMEQLRGQGYFDPQHKKPIPRMADRIAVVTSRNAAALADVKSTAASRWPGCELLLYDVRVQGEFAAGEIAAAINDLSQRGESLGIDAILVTRGGGSIEDLWAFNERVVADALFACRLPVVAAIGHETDITVAELVADQRCATPTGAAMVLVPDREALEHQLVQLSQRLRLVLRRRHQLAQQRIKSIRTHPIFRRPDYLLEASAQRLTHIQDRFKTLIPQRLAMAQQQITALQRHLQSVGPQSVLQRGFSYTTDAKGNIIRSVKQLKNDDMMQTVLADGKITSQVTNAPKRAKQPLRTKRPAKSELTSPGLFDVVE